MYADTLIRDPVFQLNLLLWMAKDQPHEQFRVRPLFREYGFSPMVIEQPFQFPVEVFIRIERSTLDISKQPEPELILGGAGNKAMYFECKAHSFGADSSNSRQARGHLVAAGGAFAEVFRPLENCLLSYVVPDSDREGMRLCLSDLRRQLADASFSPGRFSVQGLKVDGANIVYTWDRELSQHLGIAEPPSREMAVLELGAQDTYPSPLVLVYTDEDCPNPMSRDFYRRILSAKLRAALLCDLHQEAEATVVSISAGRLLASTTAEMFQYLGRERQNGLLAFVRKNILDFIVAEWKPKIPGLVTVVGQNVTLKWTTDKDRQDFLEWLEDRETDFPAERVMQGELFDAGGN